MSQQTVYIRESDMERWKAIEKKSEFIHNALIQGPPQSLQGTVERVEEIIAKPEKEIIEDIAEVFDIKLCKHGSDPNFCKFSKPGKPCK